MPASPATGDVVAYTYPYTIENGAGERLTFVRRVRDRHGESLEVENLVGPGAGPPMHVHHHQEESLTVRQGRIGYAHPGEPPRFAGPGETVVFKAGETHRFWNAGEEELVCAGYVRPPDNIEYFLTELYRSQRENAGKGPNLFDAVFLARRYRGEFGMAEIPPPVQRLVFPAVVAVGRLLGRYAKYADAPEPVRR